MAPAAVNISTVEELSAGLMGLQTSLEQSNANMDMFFLIVMGFVIYLMQAGFAFLEAGAVRSRNTVNILIKNALDAFFGGVSYWLVGYALAFGKGNGFIGYTHFALADIETSQLAHWFFQFVFAATAATIVSGAVAERCDFNAYLVYSTIVTGFIYPVVTHWAWSGEGWLTVGRSYEIDGEMLDIGYVDFAGSGVVHLLGGTVAFIGALALGPRLGRFDKETGQPVEIRGHSIPFASLGGFILVFGFFAFNGSSQGSISNPGDADAVALAVTNTVLAASGGAFTTLIMNKSKYFGDKKWSFLTTLNGSLTGMVAICAAANDVQPYMGFVVGILGGVSYMVFTWLVLRVKVDDPLDATAVHFGGGIVGVLAGPLFSYSHGVVYFWDLRSAYYLAWQLVGLVSIFAWTTVLSCILFFGLKMLKVLRVPFEYEVKGLDIPKHGETAYPAEAYGHGWGEKGETLKGLIKSSSNTVLSPAVTKEIPVIMSQAPLSLSESPEVDAMNNGHTNGGQVNGGFTPAPSSTQL